MEQKPNSQQNVPSGPDNFQENGPGNDQQNDPNGPGNVQQNGQNEPGNVQQSVPTVPGNNSAKVQDPESHRRFVPEPCCGIIPLKVAALLIGILGIAVGCLIPMMLLIDTDLYEIVVRHFADGDGGSEKDYHLLGIVIVYLYPVPQITFSIVLICGAVSDNQGQSLCWVIYSGMQMFFWTVICFILPGPGKALVLFVFLGIYFTVVVVFYYKQIIAKQALPQPMQFMPMQTYAAPQVQNYAAMQGPPPSYHASQNVMIPQPMSNVNYGPGINPGGGGTYPPQSPQLNQRY